MVLSYEGDHALFPVSIALFTFHRAFADKSVSSIQTLSDCYDLLAIAQGFWCNKLTSGVTRSHINIVSQDEIEDF